MALARTFLVASLLAGCACAGELPPPREGAGWVEPRADARPAAAARADRADVASCARRLVGQPFSASTTALAGHCLGVPGLRQRLEAASVPVDRPRPGDLVFFARGIVGVVLDVEPGGRAKFAYVRRGAVHEGVVSPHLPRTRRGSDGRVANTFLVPIQPGEPKRARRLAAELLEGFRAPTAAPPAPAPVARKPRPAPAPATPPAPAASELASAEQVFGSD